MKSTGRMLRVASTPLPRRPPPRVWTLSRKRGMIPRVEAIRGGVASTDDAISSRERPFPLEALPSSSLLFFLSFSFDFLLDVFFIGLDPRATECFFFLDTTFS